MGAMAHRPVEDVVPVDVERVRTIFRAQIDQLSARITGGEKPLDVTPFTIQLHLCNRFVMTFPLQPCHRKEGELMLAETAMGIVGDIHRRQDVDVDPLISTL